jgi:NADPH-dependent glutamate synthase beta subunit-like oxidoreductase
MKKLDLKSLLKADQEPEYALSKASGFAGAPKDFDFVAKNIPCQAACPAGTDVPAYLEAIAAGEYAKAYRINLRDNVFPAVLGRVCTRPCEPACRHGWEGLGEPVAICFAKRSADDFMQGEDVVLDPLAETTGKTVAVVGAGAAGLTVARQLQLLGHAVTVFERAAEAGGLMRQGIPEFRLPREVVEREIRQIEKTGVEIRCGESVGETIFLRELHETHDAVIVSSGNWKPNLPALPGNDLQHIRHGLDFLREINNGAAPEIGDRVVVIGGGFTAVDCVRMAKRLGAADVQLVYRRGADEMYVGESELDEMKAEGIGLQFNVQPTAFLGDGAVAGVQCVRTETNDRSSLETMAGSDFEISTDLVLLRTGQGRETDWLE